MHALLAALVTLSPGSIVGDWSGRIELIGAKSSDPKEAAILADIRKVRMMLKLEKAGGYRMDVPLSVLGEGRKESGRWFRTGREVALMPASPKGLPSNVLKLSTDGKLLVQQLGTDGETRGKIIFTRIKP